LDVLFDWRNKYRRIIVINGGASHKNSSVYLVEMKLIGSIAKTKRRGHR
jgi:hypothetical protein